MDNQRLHIPDALCILINAAIAAEEAHAGNRNDRLLGPLFLVLERLVNKIVRLVVAVEVIRHKVVIPMVAHSCDQSTKVIDRAKGALLDLGKHLLQVRVDGVRAILVGMTKVLDILREVAK